jgi:hypothetical protein
MSNHIELLYDAVLLSTFFIALLVMIAVAYKVESTR